MECVTGLVRPERSWVCGKESGHGLLSEMKISEMKKLLVMIDIQEKILHSKNYESGSISLQSRHEHIWTPTVY